MRKLVTFIALINLLPVVASTQSAAQLLKDAIYQEEISGNLDRAISLYKEIVAGFPDERSIVAEALLHLGLAHEKMGQALAKSYYQQLLNQYADQQSFAVLAKERLSALVLERPLSTSDEKRFLVHTRIAELNDMYGSVSPDGRLISFVNWTHGNMAIHEVSSGTSWDITTEGTWVGEGQFGDMSIWSPDCKKIVYLWFKGEEGELRIYNMNSRQSERILGPRPKEFPWPIKWLADNQIFFCFLTFDHNSRRYFLLDTGSGELTPLFNLEKTDDYQLDRVAIAPNGKYLALTFDYGEIGREVRIHPISDPKGVPLSVIKDIRSSPIWSHDSEFLLFVSNRFSDLALYKQRLTNGRIEEPEVLILEGFPNSFAPSSVNPVTGDLHYIANTDRNYIYLTELDWESRTFKEPKIVVQSDQGQWGNTWSPDGKKFAFIVGNPDLPYARRLAVCDLESGAVTEYSHNLRLLESPIMHTYLNWTPDGRQVLVAFNPIDEQGNPIYKNAFINVDDNTITELPEMLGRNSKSVLSRDEILLFEGEGLSKYSISTDHKQLVHPIEETNRSFLYPAINMSKSRIAFFAGNLTAEDWLKELRILDLETGHASVLWNLEETPEYGGFVYGNPIAWVNEDREVLVSVRSVDGNYMQFYTCNVLSGARKPFGEPVYGPDEKWTFTSLGPDGKSLLYGKLNRVASAWVVKNF